MPDFVVPVKDNREILNANVDVPSNKLLMEASLLGGGIKDGFLGRAKEAMQNPGLTTLEFIGTAAIGAGLTLAEKAGGGWGVAARVATKGLAVVAIGDVGRRVIPSVYAMGDSLANPGNYAQNRATIARNLGTALFDYPLMAAGGKTGSLAAEYGSKYAGTMMSKFRASSEPLGPSTDALLQSGIPINANTRGALSNPEILEMRPAARQAAIKSMLESPEFKNAGKSIDPVSHGELARPLSAEEVSAAIKSAANPKGIHTLEDLKAVLPEPKDASLGKLFEQPVRPGTQAPAKLESGKTGGWNEAELTKVDARALIDRIKTPLESGASPFNKPGFDPAVFKIDPKLFEINPARFQVPIFAEITTVRSTVFPIIPLPINEQQILQRKAEK